MGDPRKLKNYNPGEIIIHEGGTDRKMYIIKAGKVRVYKEYLGKRITIASLGEGEIFGELSFFDSKPRSASVDALTSVSVITIDAADSDAQLSNLPNWVSSILKTVFYRFRETDQKLTVLQNMNSLRKSSRLPEDNYPEKIYKEFLRLNKTLDLLLKNNDKDLSFDNVFGELFDLAGESFVPLKLYFKTLNTAEIISYDNKDPSLNLTMNSDEFKKLNNYLQSNIENEKYLTLSHATLSLLRIIISELPNDLNYEAKIEDYIKEESLKELPFYNESITELEKFSLVSTNPVLFNINVGVLHEHYIYQSIIVNFDNRVINF
jgi:hypothetical protein